jgi:NAD(P)H-nitrite reductase large subunit
MIKDWCLKQGVQVFTGTKVEAIEAAAPLRVHLSDGRSLPADLVISATGVKPSIGYLEDSGIACLAGVLTDARMQTNVPGIYAAGDCAETFDKITGKTMVSAIQPNASDQARIAGLNMAGLEAELPGVTQINVLDTLGLVSASFGDWQGAPGGEHAEVTDRDGLRHLSLHFNGDLMVGANAIGWTQHVGVLRGLIEGQVKLGEWKHKLLEDPTRIMEAYLGAAQAQGRWQGAADARRR